MNKLREDLKEFIDNKLRSLSIKHDVQGKISIEVLNLIKEKGYLGLTIPEQFGGKSISMLEYGEITEEISRVCSSIRALITVHTSLVSQTINDLGSSEQKAQWLPKLCNGSILGAFALSEPQVGSDAQNITTNYIKISNGYILNGIKKWITYGYIADLLLVIARNDNEISAFLVNSNSEGVIKKQIKDIIANRATELAEIEFNNVFVPAENLLLSEGSGFSIVTNTALDHGRYSVAWAATGIIREALESMVTYACQRVQFNKKLIDHQLIKAKIAYARTKYLAARALCEKAAILRESGDPEAMMITNVAKLFSSTSAVEVANDAWQIHGANGFIEGSVAQRLFREAKVLEVIEGSTQIQEQIIADDAICKHNKPKIFNYFKGI